VLDFVVRRPTVLLLAPETLRANVAALQALLGGVDYQIMLALITKQPSLVGFAPDALAAKHAALREAAGLPAPQVPGARRSHAQATGQSGACVPGCAPPCPPPLADAAPLPDAPPLPPPHPPRRPRQLNALLLRYPLLLTLAAAQVRATCDLLHDELGFASRRELGAFLRHHPELLVYGAPTLQVRARRRRRLRRDRLGACPAPRRRAPVRPAPAAGAPQSRPPPLALLNQGLSPPRGPSKI
jgi:hypothetical protein